MNEPFTSPDPRITLGNQQGPHFEERKFRYAIALAQKILHPEGGVPGVEQIEVDYDAAEDFTHLRFTCNGHEVDIKYYKVMGVTVDGEMNHMRWWPSGQWECIRYIRQHTDPPLPALDSTAPENPMEYSLIPPELLDLHKRAKLALEGGQQAVQIDALKLKQLVERAARAERDRTTLLTRGDALLATAESPAFGNSETAPGAEGDFLGESLNWKEAAAAARKP